MNRPKLTKPKSIKKTMPNDYLDRSERLGLGVDSVGRLQYECDKLNKRLHKNQMELMSILVGEEITLCDGSKYLAKVSENSTYKLKKQASIHTLLTSLLIRIDDEQAGKGGLFDMILQLDTKVVNEHFVPLLMAVFEKANVSSEAELLFIRDTHCSIEIIQKNTADIN